MRRLFPLMTAVIMLVVPAHADECDDFILAAAAFATISEGYNRESDVWNSAFRKVDEARSAAIGQIVDGRTEDAFTALLRSMITAGSAYVQAAKTWPESSAEGLRERVWEGTIGIVGALDAAIVYECTIGR